MTTLGTGIDGSVRRLGFSFNDAGLPYQQTSFSDTGGNTVVNQVQDAYNGYGQLVTQYQEHSGAVNTGTSLKVQYVYSQPTGANFSRMTAMIYPNGRQLDYVYNTGLDTTISRVSGLSDDGGSAAGNDQSLTYLGLNTIVQALDGNGIELTYIKQSGESNGDAGDKYIGLDRFGRVVDQRWIPTSSPTSPTDRFQYGYDRDSNVLYENNLVSSGWSQLYHANSTTNGDNNTAYDPLGRLLASQVGTLSSSGHNGSGLDTAGSLQFAPTTWSFDAVGNILNGAGTYNAQNQLTGGNAIPSPTYDNNGNTTTDAGTYTFVYNAWNQIVSVGGLDTFAYDALGRRIQEGRDQFSGNPQDRYYSTAGQELEDREGTTVTNQYVWGLAYVNDMVLRDWGGGSGDLGKTGSGLGLRGYVQQDRNWNITAITDTTGNVQDRIVTTPDGGVVTLTPTWSYVGSSLRNGAFPDWVYGFQGGRFEDGIVWRFGLRDMSSRGHNYYRWMEPDPGEYGGTIVSIRPLLGNQFPQLTPAVALLFNVSFPHALKRGGSAAVVSTPNLYVFEGDNLTTRLDPTGMRLIDFIPIIGTIHNWLVDPYGVNVGDYLGGPCGGTHMREKTKELGGPAAVADCQQCMHDEYLHNLMSYLGLPTIKDAIGVASGLATGEILARGGEITVGGALTGGVLAIDGLVDAAASLRNLTRMRDAERDAARRGCVPWNCP